MELLRKMQFPVAVIDEAARITEPKTVTALWRHTLHLILVEEHKQLPATVRASAAKDLLMEVSLFERLVQQGFPVLPWPAMATTIFVYF